MASSGTLNSSLIHNKSAVERDRSIDWNSLKLLLLLIVPTCIMAIVLFAWPDVVWIAEVPYTVIGTIGSFTGVLLSVFVVARYQDKPGVIIIGSGLLSMAVITGVQSLVSPESSEFVWLNSLAGICGGVFFSVYIVSRADWVPFLSHESISRNRWNVLILVGSISLLLGAIILENADILPVMIENRVFSELTWLVNSVPMILFLFSGSCMFFLYRRTGSRELLLYTAIVIFLFQASEVIYLASMWSIIWWFWLSLRLVVYVSVLGYVLREYIQTSNSLKVEISERRQIETALRAAEEDWRNSFDSLEEAMMIIDNDYTVCNINSSALMLLDSARSKILGCNICQIMEKNWETEDIDLITRSFELQTTQHVERYNRKLDKHFAIKSSPVFGEDGSVSKCVFLIDDITRQVQADAKEKLLQKELNLTSRLASIGEVAAGITHEINNPLTSIIAFAQLLSMQEFPDDVKEGIDVINDSANRIANIVDKLLTFARRQKKEKEYVDLNVVIASVIGMRSYEMRHSNIEITTDLSPALPNTMANMGEMQQVLLNIIINAEQSLTGAKVKPGYIHIKTEAIGKTIRIIVTDNGPGINEQHVEKLFDPFFTTKDESGGTGLGLSISYGIIQEHGGRIYLDNGNSDQGARFVIELPVKKQIEPVEAEGSPETDQSEIAGAKILVIDDETYICRALSALLSREGHYVETVSVAEKGLEKIRDTQYDLILLDIKMPGTDGIEFYHSMEQVNTSMDTKVICITGDIITTKNKAFLEETGIPYITKPFGINELKRLVQDVIGGKSSNAEITYSHS